MNSTFRKTVFLLSIFIVLFISYVGYNYHKHFFTVDKWQKYIENRQYMLSDMLNKYELIGMTQNEVIELLGLPDSHQMTFKGTDKYYSSDTTIIYYIGKDDIFHLDSQYLILILENGLVKNIDYGVT